MKLEHLQVAQHGAGAEGHGEAVAGGDCGVRRFAIDAAGAASGEYGGGGPEHLVAVLRVIGDDALHLAVARKQVDGEAVFEDADARVLADAFEQGAHDLAAGGVARA
jgi:hypothetical protein